MRVALSHCLFGSTLLYAAVGEVYLLVHLAITLNLANFMEKKRHLTSRSTIRYTMNTPTTGVWVDLRYIDEGMNYDHANEAIARRKSRNISYSDERR
jgi:hypothetical protein